MTVALAASAAALFDDQPGPAQLMRLTEVHRETLRLHDGRIETDARPRPRLLRELAEAGTALAVAIVFFAVTDLVAAVGLWLASSWGGVIWLCAAAAQIFVTLFMPTFFAGGPIILGVDLGLVLAYFFLTWRAAQEFDL